MRALVIASLLLLTSQAATCGQKGPLVPPDQGRVMGTPVALASAAGRQASTP